MTMASEIAKLINSLPRGMSGKINTETMKYVYKTICCLCVVSSTNEGFQRFVFSDRSSIKMYIIEDDLLCEYDS